MRVYNLQHRVVLKLCGLLLVDIFVHCLRHHDVMMAVTPFKQIATEVFCVAVMMIKAGTQLKAVLSHIHRSRVCRLVNMTCFSAGAWHGVVLTWLC